MTAHALLFTLACIGIAETVYLIKKRKVSERPVCVIGENCAKVLESQYNRLFGVNNDVLGLLFYIAVSVITALIVIGIGNLLFWEKLAKIAILAGAALSIFLTYLQWKVIRAWCFWCIMSAATVFLMALIVMAISLV